jgi:ABC-type phosphate transport system permease subunit
MKDVKTIVGVLGPTAHPGLPLKVLLGVGRCYVPTVARWFVLGAREIVDNDVHVRAALKCVTPYVLVRVLYVMGYKGVL